MSDDGRGPADPQVVERMKKQLGLDDPVYMRFGAYIARLATGDLGTSFRTREPVTTMIAKRMWPTLQLIFAAMMFAIVIGVPLGFIAALRPGGIVDTVSMVVAVSGPALAAGSWLRTSTENATELLRPVGSVAVSRPLKIPSSSNVWNGCWPNARP